MPHQPAGWFAMTGVWEVRRWSAAGCGRPALRVRNRECGAISAMRGSTDCHTSDAGHWLAMTGIMEVRCMSAGRRGRCSLRKGQQEVQCAASGGVRAPHPTHGSRVRCAGNTDRRVAALLATAVFWWCGGYRSLLIRPAAPAPRRWHPGWERSRPTPSCCRLRRGRGRER